MEIQVSANVEAKLREHAAREGREPTAVAAEVLEEMFDYEAWYLARVDEGLAKASKLIPHEEVAAHVEQLLSWLHAKTL